MSKFLKERSQYLITKVKKYYLQALLAVGLIFLISIILYKIKDLEYSTWIYGTVPLLIFVLCIFKSYSKNETQADHYRKGNIGEKSIEEILKKLPDTYNIIPDIQSPRGGNIDFVVVGPTGIFALEVKNFKYATIRFNGQQITFNGKPQKKDPLAQALRNATALGEKLHKKLNTATIFIKPVVVFASPMNIHFGFKPIKEVIHVVCKEYLLELITRQKTSLSQEEIENISAEINQAK